MAYMLFKYIRRKVRENKAKKEGFSTADDTHLTPNIAQSPTRAQHEEHELLSSPNSHTASPQITKTNPMENKVEHERFRQQERSARIRRWKLILGLILPNFLASVDVTIVAPAITTISSHFGE